MAQPLAYLITFNTYGTWLHGDERGSVDREHRAFHTPLVDPSSELRGFERSELKEPPYEMDESAREIVLAALLEVCRYRRWHARSIHVRTAHVHAVVTSPATPEKVMNDFKAYASRALNRTQMGRTRYWASHGSTRYLWSQEQVIEEVTYVRDQQGERMQYGEFNPETEGTDRDG